MTWQYLEKLAYRWYQWLPYVDSFTNKHVVELNCGDTQIDKALIGQPIELFQCNDTKECSQQRLFNGSFYQVSDERFGEYILKCDILLLFGIGGYEITGAEQESKTITSSTINFIKEYAPELVVIEGVTRFEPLLERISAESGYERVARLETLSGDDWLHHRVMYILKPK